MIRRHVNRLVCGEERERPSEGLHVLLERELGARRLGRGVSVGAGIGAKEMRLLQRGLVESFDLYELSARRIDKGRELAASLGLGERVRFHHRDAFEADEIGEVDLVYWDMALHHMLDVERAVAWSRRILAPDGVFCMHDFVGPSRFQWSDASLALVEEVRSSLPREYLADPSWGREQVAVRVERLDPKLVEKDDPSEAAQSDRILEAVRRHFPDAAVRLTGGTIYHLALRDIIHNFDEADDADATLLSELLQLDEATIGEPGIDNHYAVAIAGGGPG